MIANRIPPAYLMLSSYWTITQRTNYPEESNSEITQPICPIVVYFHYYISQINHFCKHTTTHLTLDSRLVSIHVFWPKNVVKAI